MLAVLIEKSLSQPATCNPQNRECSCADTSSRVVVFGFLKVFCFIFSIFLNHQLKLRTVRTSFHQRGSVWTILKHAWTCAKWARIQKQPSSSLFLHTMTYLQVLNPLGQCEWLLFHYSPVKGEKSFIPPYLNCEVGKTLKYVYSDVQTILTMLFKLCIISEFIQITQPHLTEN